MLIRETGDRPLRLEKRSPLPSEHPTGTWGRWHIDCHQFPGWLCRRNSQSVARTFGHVCIGVRGWTRRFLKKWIIARDFRIILFKTAWIEIRRKILPSGRKVHKAIRRSILATISSYRRKDRSKVNSRIRALNKHGQLESCLVLRTWILTFNSRSATLNSRVREKESYRSRKDCAVHVYWPEWVHRAAGSIVLMNIRKIDDYGNRSSMRSWKSSICNRQVAGTRNMARNSEPTCFFWRNMPELVLTSLATAFPVSSSTTIDFSNLCFACSAEKERLSFSQRGRLYNETSSNRQAEELTSSMRWSHSSWDRNPSYKKALWRKMPGNHAQDGD